MHSMLVTLWTHEPYGFPLYNTSKHGDRSPNQLEMNMQRAAQRLANGEELYIPCTVAHTNQLNGFLREELKARRDEALQNYAREGGDEDAEGRRQRAMEAAKKAKEEGLEKVREARSESNSGLEATGLEWTPRKKKKKEPDEAELARMKFQLGMFD